MSGIIQNKKWIQIVSAFVSIAIFGYIFFSTAFMHAHTLPDGNIVVHSHYSHDSDEKKESKSGSHQHSDAEFLFYSIILKKLNLFILFFTAFAGFIIVVTYINLYKKEIPHLPFINFNYPLRAPPAFH